MRALLFDCETTGVKEPEAVEAGYADAQLGADGLAVRTIHVIRLRPSKPIELGALATHGIMDEELVHCAASSTLPTWLPPADFLVGHNVDFDWAVAGKPETKRICTLALARMVWPTLDSHSLTALIYHVDRAAARDRFDDLRPHGAAADISLTAILLDHLLPAIGSPDTWDALWEISERARIPTHMPFGKHKGTPIAEVPRDYKAWLLGQPDVDPYLRKALAA